MEDRKKRNQAMVQCETCRFGVKEGRKNASPFSSMRVLDFYARKKIYLLEKSLKRR